MEYFTKKTWKINKWLFANELIFKPAELQIHHITSGNGVTLVTVHWSIYIMISNEVIQGA